MGWNFESLNLRGVWFIGIELGSTKVMGTFLLLTQLTLRVTFNQICINLETLSVDWILCNPSVTFSSIQPLEFLVILRISCPAASVTAKLSLVSVNELEISTGIRDFCLKCRGMTFMYVLKIPFWAVTLFRVKVSVSGRILKWKRYSLSHFLAEIEGRYVSFSRSVWTYNYVSLYLDKDS